MKLFFVIIGLFICQIHLFSQSPYILRGDQAYHTYDRSEILKWADTTLVNSINNYDRKLSVAYFKSVWNNDDLSSKDRFDLLHIFSDNLEFLEKEATNISSEDPKDLIFRDGTVSDSPSIDVITGNRFNQKPIFKYFYKTPANFLRLETPTFDLMVNPILQVSYYNEVNNQNIVFQNTRGLEARGYIDGKVYFYTQLLENQRSYLSYVEDRIIKFSTLPGQGFWKSYTSSVVDNLKGYDFFNARAYIGFNPVKSINLEFGHGNHFIGNGIRSLLLSDYSHNYFYLKLNTRIWKFQYQNLFAELAPTSTFINPGNNLLPKKYSATHYLAFKPNTKFEIGLFETVIFARENHFEFQYLNPVILYRAVEHYLDSPDNVILGLNAKWNPTKGISLYGQLIMDEFKLSEVRKQTGWWANKFGAQFGLKYINVLGIDHLDLQVEYNAVRPYTYAHRDSLPRLGDYSIANYSHSNQPLAHPLGANFKELLFLARYKPYNRWYIQAKVLMTTYGDDRPGENWGSNILSPLQTIQMEYGNTIGQGVSTKVAALNVDISYELFHNYFIDLQGMWRNTTTNISVDQHYIGGGFRVNIANLHYDY
jgi:hypothetical protein